MQFSRDSHLDVGSLWGGYGRFVVKIEPHNAPLKAPVVCCVVRASASHC